MARTLALAVACSLFLSLPSGANASTIGLDAVLVSRDWVNGHPSSADLHGKVVFIDVYTFDCINCRHVEPNLRELYRSTSRSDLVIIGVHSPETPAERDRSNLIASMKAQGVVWPVAIDNDFRVWNAYGIQAWPTQLIFDRHGVLRRTVIGEGQDGDVDGAIRELIAER